MLRDAPTEAHVKGFNPREESSIKPQAGKQCLQEQNEA
jgi:hypothetical protein